MFDFDAMATFVEVVQLGSFSAAAAALDGQPACGPP
ncbi:helix-turn-helix domain-containing protein [Sorangium sp. So ce128]